MSVLGNYEVHKSDHACNKKVLDAIALAKLMKTPRDYIDCLSGGKETKDIREEKDNQRLVKRKENLVENDKGEER